MILKTKTSGRSEDITNDPQVNSGRKTLNGMETAVFQ
jgi:hypothetical protein